MLIIMVTILLVNKILISNNNHPLDLFVVHMYLIKLRKYFVYFSNKFYYDIFHQYMYSYNSYHIILDNFCTNLHQLYHNLYLFYQSMYMIHFCRLLIQSNINRPMLQTIIICYFMDVIIVIYLIKT